jgi:hypothetical protein
MLQRRDCQVQNLQPHRAHLAGVEALEALLLTRSRILAGSSRRSRGTGWKGTGGGTLPTEAAAGLRLATLGATGSTGGTSTLGETGGHAAGDTTGEARGEATALATEAAESTGGEAAWNSAGGDRAGGGKARRHSARGSGLLSLTGGVSLTNVLGRYISRERKSSFKYTYTYRKLPGHSRGGHEEGGNAEDGGELHFEMLGCRTQK